MMQGTANEIVPEDIQVRFDDVKGCDEAKQELQDIVEFLMNPEKISALGGRLPKGVLLSGKSVNFSVWPNGRNLGLAIFTEPSAKLRQENGQNLPKIGLHNWTEILLQECN